MEMDDSDSENIVNEEDDYLINNNILLRNYQSKLLGQAKKGNSIIYLPTGAGKTLIAVHLLISRKQEIIKPLSEGGKRAFFVVVTKVMTLQIQKVLMTHSKFKSAVYNGEMNVDAWSEEKWRSLLDEYHVSILTADIFKHIVTMGFIEPKNMSLIVFDECHHATKNHAYKLILEKLMSYKCSEQPLLLGLSSVLIKNNVNINQISQSIQNLQTIFQGEVIFEPEFQEVMRFVSQPQEKIVLYKDVEENSTITTVCKIYDRAMEIFENVSTDVSNRIIPEDAYSFKNTSLMAKLRRAFAQAKEHIFELGIFGGSLSTILFVFLVEKYRLLSNDPDQIQFLVFARTELHKIRHILVKHMGDDTDSLILQYSSPKVLKLIQTLEEANSKYKGNFSAIVFVQQRLTAILLAYLLKRLSLVSSYYSFIKAEFIVGSSIFTQESYVTELKNEEVIEKFSTRSVNVLVCTSVVEEGVDIGVCNVVIHFDFPSSYCSYFQSKGRARHLNSLYHVFIKETEYSKKIAIFNSYKAICDELLKTLSAQNNLSDDCDDDCSLNSDLEKMTIAGKEKVLVVDGITAIKAVDRYTSKLPQDKYSLLSSISWYKKIDTTTGPRRVAYVQLPTNCSLIEVIEGEPRKNKIQAKRSAYLITLKRLMDLGVLDDDLNPKRLNIEEKDFKHLFPNFKQEKIDKNLPQPGTKKRKQLYRAKFAECLSECLPRAGIKTYLHVIDMTVAFEKPELERKVVIYDLLQLPVTFALLSSKKLRKIFEFPLFLNLGQINCNLLVNYDSIVLTQCEIDDIKKCHFALFQKVTRALKSCQIFDNRNKEHSFFVAPVEKNKSGRFVLNWDLIRCDFCQNNQSSLVRYNPTSNRSINITKDFNHDSFSNNSTNSLVAFEESKSNYEDPKKVQFMVNETDYKYFVIYPNYRNEDPPRCYVVDKICHNMSPLTKFPRAEFADYFSYYKLKYLIEITNSSQPLLKATALYDCSNFYRPTYRKSKREREKFKEHEEHLVPELCGLIPFDRRYWLKGLLVPTVLNRIYHVYLVEEFRLKVIQETGLGVCDLPNNVMWKPLVVKTCLRNEEEETPFGLDSSMSLSSSLPLSELKSNSQAQSNNPFILERNLYDIGICDLEFFLENVEDSETERVLLENMENEEAPERDVRVPHLNLLHEKQDKFGPDLAQFVEVFTSKSAKDIINYERLEILGDSFLKFATALYLFKNYPDNEGVLTMVKGKLVGNRNLLYCGNSKNIENVINVSDFEPLFDWNPPLICVPEELIDKIISNNVEPAVLRLIEIPPHEQLSGVLSENTLTRNKQIVEEHEKNCDCPMNSLLAHKAVADKTVSDCVEALIGVYLFSLGLPSAFEILMWLGVLPRPDGSYSKLVLQPYKARLLGSETLAGVTDLLNDVFYSDLEELLDYRFENKAFLLEALSHPSYIRNRVTHCYQRLEFLGDAVLDFLVTAYIYENQDDLTPGQVTDIRSSLVNNITFACLVVRYGIYKYLLSFSTDLNKDVENFVSFQKSRNHVVDDNVLILLEENNCMIAETLTVPKALGDLFESLAGAIFLDSGNSLETVWKVYYKLMKRELEAFTKTVPKTAIRLLFEICGDKPYFENKVLNNQVKTTCSVYYENQIIEGHGFGKSKKEAKKSAAKVVLNKIMTLKKSNES